MPRLWGWMLLAASLIGMVAFVAPQQAPIMLYKLSMIIVAAVFSYWIDRSLFKNTPQARLEAYSPRDLFHAMRMLARALIYVGTVLGITLGL